MFNIKIVVREVLPLIYSGEYYKSQCVFMEFKEF